MLQGETVDRSPCAQGHCASHSHTRALGPFIPLSSPLLPACRERQEAEAHSRAHKGTALAAEEAAERRREAEARRKEELAAKVEAKALRKELAQVRESVRIV